MSAPTDHKLYQSIILDHNQNPRNFGPLENTTHFFENSNPLCGDKIRIYLKASCDQTIEAINFDGEGCAISQASASMMTEILKGKTIEQGRKIFELFNAFVTGKDQAEKGALGELAIFSSIWQYPSRMQCVLLSWNAFNGALEKKK